MNAVGEPVSERTSEGDGGEDGGAQGGHCAALYDQHCDGGMEDVRLVLVRLAAAKS